MCAWCLGSLAGKRRDARFCSTRCRQASHRFAAGAASVVPDVGSAVAQDLGRSVALRMAYADPPYRSKSGLYVGHPDYAGEVDQRELIARLVDEFPDGWALSCSSESLQDLLSWCPRTVRIAAWVKGERATRSHRPLCAWEPVIVYGGRPQLTDAAERRSDSLVYGVAPRLTDPRRVIGAKPAAFCYWMFTLLGAQPGDDLVDLFPGSGGVARAWAEVIRRADPRHGSARAADDASRPGGYDASPPPAHDESAAAPGDGFTTVTADESRLTPAQG